KWFGEFAAVMFDALGDRVPYWITLNEPIGASFYAYSGSHAPGLRLGGPAIAAAHHLLLGHAEAVRAFRAGGHTGQIGITLNFGPPTPATDDPADVVAAERADALSTRWFSDAVLSGTYPKILLDFWQPISDFAFIHDGDLAAISAPLDFLG